MTDVSMLAPPQCRAGFGCLRALHAEEQAARRDDPDDRAVLDHGDPLALGVERQVDQLVDVGFGRGAGQAGDVGIRPLLANASTGTMTECALTRCSREMPATNSAT